MNAERTSAPPQAGRRSAGGATRRPPACATVRRAMRRLTDARPRRWLEESQRLDVAVYAAIAATPTPTMDEGLRRLSRAADHSKLWLGSSALLAAFGGRRGRRAAENGLASIALASAVVNLGLKPLGNRRRPDRATADVPLARQVAMPRSTSWPSGHSASAFAFATGVGAASPAAGAPLAVVATLVAYSRVHTGVHYPSDAIAGTAVGVALAPVAVAAVGRRRRITSSA
jgi:membrane-associated phospholipid phosphatase